jgi:hypothetical protein
MIAPADNLVEIKAEEENVISLDPRTKRAAPQPQLTPRILKAFAIQWSVRARAIRLTSYRR